MKKWILILLIMIGMVQMVNSQEFINPITNEPYYHIDKYIIKIECTYNSKIEEYSDGTGNTIIGGQMYANSNCLKIEEALSLKDCEFADKYKIDINVDEKYPLTEKDIIDYNFTSITLNPKLAESELNKDIPIKVYTTENVLDEKTQEYKGIKTTIYSDNVNLKSIDEKQEYVIPFGFDREVHIGENSTNISFEVEGLSNYAMRKLLNLDWDTVHDATTADYLEDDIRIDVSNATGQELRIYRAFIPFNTSELPDDITIESIKLYGKIQYYGNVVNDGKNYLVVVGNTTQGTWNSLSTSDYNDCGSVDNPHEYSEHLSLNGLSAEQEIYIDFIDFTGINLAGISMLGLRLGWDVEDIEPNGFQSSLNYLDFYDTNDGASDLLSLNITYIIEEPSDNNNFTVDFNLFLNDTETDIIVTEGDTFYVYYYQNTSMTYLFTRNDTIILNNSLQDLSVGYYNFTISVNDTTKTNFNTLSRYATINIRNNYSMDITIPTTSLPIEVYNGDNISFTLNLTENDVEITTEVTYNNATIGGKFANITYTTEQSCTGTLDCSIYSDESSCNNCNQCSYDINEYNITSKSIESTVGDISLVLDSTGEIHIIHDSSIGIRHCNGTNIDSISCETVTEEIGSYTSMAIDNNDYIHIASGNSSDGTLFVCDNTLGSWTCDTEIVYAGVLARYTSIAIDENNKRHVVIGNNTYPNNPIYCTDKTGSWVCDDISESEGGLYLSIITNNTDDVHIANGNGFPKYCKIDGEGLNYEQIDTEASSEYSSLKIDSNGIHMSWRDYTDSDVRYCTGSYSSWSCEDVAVGDYFWTCLISDENEDINIFTLDPSGDNKVKWWTKDGTWQSLDIETDPERTGVDGKWCAKREGRDYYGNNNFNENYYLVWKNDTSNNLILTEISPTFSCNNNGACSSCSLNECDTNCSDAGCSVETNRYKQFGFNIEDNLWHGNLSIPYFESGLKNLFINSTYSGITINNTQIDAVNYLTITDTCSPTSPLTGDYSFDCSDNCVLTTDIDAGGYTISSYGTGSLTFVNSKIYNYVGFYNRCDYHCHSSGSCIE